MSRSGKPSRKPDIGDLLKQFAAKEDEFLTREFLAPALSSGVVRVRIAGVDCRIRIAPDDFAGWGIFQPLSHREAILVREATLSERRSYLQLFPLIRLIVCRRQGATWLGAAAHFGDRRIQIDGMVPIELADEIQLFDCVQTRFDGNRFWYDEVDRRHDPAVSAYLRTALSDRIEPADLYRSGLTSEERAAYELNYLLLFQPTPSPSERRRSRKHSTPQPTVSDSDPIEQRLRETLSHGGAQLVDYLERCDGFRVSFRIGNQQHTSSVDKDDLTVQVAGVCLSGQDEKFDLNSLVGVLREGDENGQLYFE